ncbi:hypothetical protein RND81_13G013100 [Saponaria officinalis]|uniref:3-beta hydroxysteroid dehydrogenase/isomerase domain-containing protein n=1 Tax=Saponaria officinalis TaxID=3572 RepID=A0AAW1GYB5_SAPOF
MAPSSFVPISNTVCVMDASGCLGASLVKRLLQRGYIVHAALQHPLFEELKGLCKDEKERLKVFQCDVLCYQSIVDALKGCFGLFYNFELPHDQPIYDEDMVETEIRAAHNVLEACAQVDTIDKVVFTSSITAVIWNEDRTSISSSHLNEKYWSDISLCRKFKLWHAISKTLAEKTAWALAMDRGISMVTVNAGLVMDNRLSIAHPYLKGASEMYRDGVLVTVDLEFLVDAHICVFEDVSAYGRYLCFNHVITCPDDAIKFAKLLLPSASVQPQSFGEDCKVIEPKISNKKLSKLIMEFESHNLDEDSNQLLFTNY